jgi:fructose-1,6-bisphosphatase
LKLYISGPSITTPEAIPNPCPAGYVSYGMDCFLYVSTKSTWQAADADCKRRKTFLATINVVSFNPVHGKVYSIQHYVIKFVSDLQQVSSFLEVT